MFERIRDHLTYSNVMVTLLAFVVLGGGGVAIGGVINKQGKIKACYVKRGENRGEVRLLVKGKCSRAEKKIVWNQRGVRGNQGPPGSVTGPADLANDSVNSAKVANGSLTAADLGLGSVGAGQLVDVTRREGTGLVPLSVAGGPWNHGTATAFCLPGEQLIAGNAAWDNEAGGDPLAIVEIVPDFAAHSVTVTGASDTAADRTLRAIAICLP